MTEDDTLNSLYTKDLLVYHYLMNNVIEYAEEVDDYSWSILQNVDSRPLPSVYAVTWRELSVEIADCVLFRLLTAFQNALFEFG